MDCLQGRRVLVLIQEDVLFHLEGYSYKQPVLPVSGPPKSVRARINSQVSYP